MHRLIILIFIFSYHAQITTHSDELDISCPTQFELSSQGSCFTLLEPTRNFCEANQKCAHLSYQYGQFAYLLGTNYVKYDFLNNHRNPYWTSVNRLTVTDIHDTNKWTDASPNGYVKDSSFVQFIRTDNELPILVTTSKPNELEMSGQRGLERDVICEHDEKFDYLLEKGNTHGLTNYVQFVQDKSFLLNGIVSKSPHTDGCFQVSETNSVVQCNYVCAKETFCKQTYFHNGNQLCLQMLYVPAAIPSIYQNPADEWVSFRRSYKS